MRSPEVVGRLQRDNEESGAVKDATQAENYTTNTWADVKLDQLIAFEAGVDKLLSTPEFFEPGVSLTLCARKR